MTQQIIRHQSTLDRPVIPHVSITTGDAYVIVAEITGPFTTWDVADALIQSGKVTGQRDDIEYAVRGAVQWLKRRGCLRARKDDAYRMLTNRRQKYRVTQYEFTGKRNSSKNQRAPINAEECGVDFVTLGMAFLRY